MRIKKIHDISRKIHPFMVNWPGDRDVEIKREAALKNGDACNWSSIAMGLHTGTHVDAPLHFIETGKDASSLDLNSFIGCAKVFELKSPRCITADDIQGLIIGEGDIVLFKTLNSARKETNGFFRDYTYLDASAARLLTRKNVRTVGIDYLSVDGFNEKDFPVHRLLLSHNIGIIEGLCLDGIEEGTYFLSCLPLNIRESDGSPVRAALLEME